MKGLVLQYKGFIAFARYYPEDGYYHGTLESIQAHASFGGETIEEVTQDFHDLVDDYLSDVKEISAEYQKKLIINMDDYPFHTDQAVSLQFAEPISDDIYTYQ